MLEERPLASRPRGLNLAWVLAVAYLLVIAYASLQPFSGWWQPPPEIRRFLFAPWPHYITLEDVLVNIGAYLPLGFLVARALMRHLGPASAVAAAALFACATSVAMETIQMFMPTRIASNVDVLTNSLGGLIGALVAPLFAPTRMVGIRLARVRRAWFTYGQATDIGLVLLCVWLATQLNPTAQLFGTGNLRGTLDLPALFIHTPRLLLAAEASVAALNVLALGLTTAALTRDRVPRAAAIALLLAAAFAIKTLAAVFILKSAGPFTWLTPGVVAGVVIAVLLLCALVRAPKRAQWIIASLCFAAAIAVINLAPENPYQNVPSQFLTGPTHLLSFSAIVSALSELWPFLALAYTALGAAQRA